MMELEISPPECPPDQKPVLRNAAAYPASAKSPLLFELSVPGRLGVSLPKCDVPETPLPAALLRENLGLPELDEGSVVRHFTALSAKNFSIDGNFYPLGSCTMKYNPKMNEEAASLRGWRRTHPLLPETAVQGALDLLYRLQESLKAITGFPAFSLQAAAGAQGELAGALMIRAYHRDRGDLKRKRILIPDSAHGTNPATCTMAGFTAETIPSDARGAVDMEALIAACAGEKAGTLAGLMITNPGTLGLFEERIREIIAAVHRAGGLVYGDGANMNALIGVLKPADLGFDVMHLNLHKTFSTPHGGGGPGAGAVGAGALLAEYLPGPAAVRAGGAFTLKTPGKSIGRLKAFNGNFGVLVRAYAYIRHLGREGIRRVAEYSVLNANYLKHLTGGAYPPAYGAERPCMHEFAASPQLGNGVSTVDIAKRLIDYGFHPPTVYFPLIVREALMIEPTETETKETLEAFAAALLAIAAEAKNSPELLKTAPHHTPVGRLDETAAARKPALRYTGPAANGMNKEI
ncbi:MAG: aminomethyl-transferring glycine dehydrogenase subunit GcvPB [Treponema sp.]|jgi:glycine dehydrogenase subunit 2|nr:aminomethyl-transferring glycine dehydrogenase subunit GcvPB [Treponema sp.]